MEGLLLQSGLKGDAGTGRIDGESRQHPYTTTSINGWELAVLFMDVLLPWHHITIYAFSNDCLGMSKLVEGIGVNSHTGCRSVQRKLFCTGSAGCDPNLLFHLQVTQNGVDQSFEGHITPRSSWKHIIGDSIGSWLRRMI